MANNYIQFSEQLFLRTKEETEWAESRLEDMTSKFHESYGEEGWSFEWEVHAPANGDSETAHVWIYSEEGGEPEHVAFFVQEFLEKFRPEECFSLTWACTCSKLRVGEFDGGGIFVTAKELKWFVPSHDIAKARKKFYGGLKKK